MINLENFNPLDPLFPGFSSPRSKKALYRLAYNDHELLKKTENVLLAEEGPIPHHLLGFLGIKAEFYEQKRLEKVKKALEEREKIIEEDFEKEFKKAEREENSGVKIDNSSFIEKQKAKIEKMVGKKVKPKILFNFKCFNN